MEVYEALSIFQAVFQGFMWVNLLVLTTTLRGWYFHQTLSTDLVRDHTETDSGPQSTSLPMNTWPGLGGEGRFLLEEGIYGQVKEA